MRIRTIKPGFWTSEDMATVSDQAVLLAIGLLNYADDEGYFSANCALIRAAIFPLREVRPIGDLLQELAAIGYIALCVGTDGRAYGRVAKFTDHQRVSHPAASQIAPYWQAPERSAHPPESSVKAPQTLHGPSCLKGREGKGREGEGKAPPAPSSERLESRPDPTDLFSAPATPEQIERALVKPAAPLPPERTVGDLIAVGAIVRGEDRDGWDAALKRYGFPALEAAITSMRASGAKTWVDAVIANVTKTGGSAATPTITTRVIDGVEYRIHARS